MRNRCRACSSTSPGGLEAFLLAGVQLAWTGPGHIGPLTTRRLDPAAAVLKTFAAAKPPAAVSTSPPFASATLIAPDADAGQAAQAAHVAQAGLAAAAP
ncbi:MAG: hypothetical protein M3O15_03290, partial [Acidobacteriota bacterium]|nr:hypothetical protein [Acidobacteriota bacterium]